MHSVGVAVDRAVCRSRRLRWQWHRRVVAAAFVRLRMISKEGGAAGAGAAPSVVGTGRERLGRRRCAGITADPFVVAGPRGLILGGKTKVRLFRLLLLLLRLAAVASFFFLRAELSVVIARFGLSGP